MIDETHDPALRSWVESANREGCEFPIQNLPLGAFRGRPGGAVRPGLAIGDAVFDVGDWIPGETLAGYLALNKGERRDLRHTWSRCLRAGAPPRALLPQSECEMCLPCPIGDYTDFYASIHHATNVGALFRPDNPLLPNYRHLPVAYHGRASSIVVSGTPVHRPSGQLGQGRFGPTEELDYEVELGAFVGPGNDRGRPIPIAQAEDHLVGICLLNDWSARDIQRWEYQPLGPFLAKNFATTISPWIVTAEALAPFRVATPARDVIPLPYLQSNSPDAFDITVEAWLQTPRMSSPVLLTATPFREMYWTFRQMITHHASNGCPLRPGDLIGSGTISGAERTHRGCLLELTERGRELLRLPSGETRAFLEDGDVVTLRARCHRDGFRSLGFGSCTGQVIATHL